MIIRNLLGENSAAYPTTIIKMLLNKNVINNFLVSFSKMKNQGTVYNDELLNSNKKFEVMKRALNSKTYFYISGWQLPDENIEGPYISGHEVIFYNKVEKLMLLFTYFPIHSLNIDDRNDILIREMKSYVYDNVSLNDVVIDSEITLESLMSYNTLTARYTSDSNQLLKIVRIYDEYRWQFIQRDKNENND